MLLLTQELGSAQRESTRRPGLVDPFGRAITYLRVSVTDRCDFRCVYCMAEHMTFLPKRDLLTLDELDRVCSAFVAHGVRKLRITGGEPLVRRNMMGLFRSLVAPPGIGRPRRAHPDDQRLPARALRRRTRRLRRAAGERLARHARPREIQEHHALGRPRAGAGRDRRRAGSGPAREGQHGRPQGRQRGRDRNPDRMGARARHGPDPDRGHAARRHRAEPPRPVPAACPSCGRACPDGTRSTTSTIARAGRRATCG